MAAFLTCLRLYNHTNKTFGRRTAQGFVFWRDHFLEDMPHAAGTSVGATGNYYTTAVRGGQISEDKQIVGPRRPKNVSSCAKVIVSVSARKTEYQLAFFS
jgi:hypothetical protein